MIRQFENTMVRRTPMQSPFAVAALLRMATQNVPTSEDGQDLLEYGLLAALIAMVALGAVTVVGQTIYNVFWQVIQQAFGAAA
jgi:Flp pilus assembly pilin Flp